MYKLKDISIYASEISEFLNLPMKGSDFIVSCISSIRNISDNSIMAIQEFSENLLQNLKKHKNILIISLDIEIELPEGISIIFSKDSSIDFISVINNFFIEVDSVKIAKTSFIHPSAKLGRNISIGENTVIGSNVSISDNTIIQNNVVITGRVTIGENCIIKNNATIGSEGYKFEKDLKGRLIHAPQIGSIIIGDRVWIGSNSCVETSYINDTVIEDGVKIDDLVQIGYNCFIESNSMITAGAILSNNITIRNSAFIGLNSSIKENIIIGSNSIIGMGSVILNDVEDDSVYVGNPAKFLKCNKKGDK